MTTKATHRDATSMASVQVSLTEYLSGYEEPVEISHEKPEIDPSVDLSLKVGVGKGRNHYHVMLTIGDAEIIPACPNHELEIVSLEAAAEDGCLPCDICEPVDWRDSGGQQ